MSSFDDAVRLVRERVMEFEEHFGFPFALDARVYSRESFWAFGFGYFVEVERNGAKPIPHERQIGGNTGWIVDKTTKKCDPIPGAFTPEAVIEHFDQHGEFPWDDA